MASDLSSAAALLYRSGTPKDYPFSGAEVSVGYDSGNQVRVSIEGVSRRHARITFDGQDYWIEDAGSSNGTFLNGVPVLRRERLRHLDVVGLGRRSELIFVRKAVGTRRTRRRGILSASLQAIDGADAGERREIPRGLITLGRAPSNNVVVRSELVSKAHARIERLGLELILTDLQSANGTLVNGKPVTTRALEDGDEISLGKARTFRVQIEVGEIETSEIQAAPTIDSTGGLPTEWKTRLEWTPEEMAVFEKARGVAAPPKVEAPLKGGKPSPKAKPAAGKAEPKASPAPAKSDMKVKVKAREEGKAAPPGKTPPAAAGPEAKSGVEEKKAAPSAAIGEAPAGKAPSAPPASSAPERPDAAQPAKSAPPPQAKPLPAPSTPPAGPDPGAVPSKPAQPPPSPAPEKERPGPPVPAASAAARPVPAAASQSASGRSEQTIAVRRPPPPSPAPAVPASQAVAAADSRVVLEGRVLRFALAVGDHDVGRVPQCAIHLESPQISRRHAVVHVTPVGIMVEDLKSANGTFVNGKRVTDRQTLGDGDELRFGDLAFRVRVPVLDGESS